MIVFAFQYAREDVIRSVLMVSVMWLHFNMHVFKVQAYGTTTIVRGHVMDTLELQL